MRLTLSTSMIIDQTYHLTEKIGEGGMSTVFRAYDMTHHRQVALKFLKESVTSSFIEDVIRFKQEINIISKLSDPGILKLYGAGEYQGVPFLITELLDGKNLTEFLIEQKPVSLEISLDMMEQLVQSLHTLHSHGIIHRDLKPDNIMVQKENNRYLTKILDFGLSLLVEFDQIKSEEAVAGTFGYMSPEGTGILKRKIDERSDLYSLGITFYQLLTGEIPFKSKEISKLIHEQIAATPTPLRKIKNDIPPVLEQIVLKLIQKDPEVRYQSAKGLLHDIRRFREGQRDFVIGEKDQKIKLSYQTGMVGREKEIEKLKALYEEAKKGHGKVCVVHGESGIGKNKLVEEIRKCALEDGLLFIEGRCLDQSKKSPYYPFKEAIDQFLKKINRLEDADKKAFSAKLKETLGEHSEVAARLHTGLEALLGPSSSVAGALSPEAETQRFLTVMSNLFMNLSSEPVILFIDDLQWADETTRLLFTELASKIQSGKFFLLAAMSGSTGADLENELLEMNVPLVILELKPLTLQPINRLVANILGEKEEKCLQLAAYIFEKSQGNPFFSVAALREFVEEKALVWTEQGWEADWEKIKKIPVPRNLLHWIIGKINCFKESEQELLQLCALIGQEIDLNLLVFITSSSTEEILQTLDRAIHFQLLIPSARGQMVFSHEKIRDHFLGKIEPDKKKGFHYKIAQTLEIIHQNSSSVFFMIKNLPSEQRNYYLNMATSLTENKLKLEPYYFQLADHYQHAGDKEKTLEYSLLAADKARVNYANEQALHYYEVAIRLLEAKGLGEHPDAMAAKEAVADICLTAGKYEKAETFLREILQSKKDPFEKLKVYQNVITAHLKKGDLSLAEHYVLEGLSLMGERVPQKRLGLWGCIAKEFLVHFFLGIAAPKNETFQLKDPFKIFFYNQLHSIYLLKDSERFLWCSYKLLHLAKSKMPNSKELAVAQAAFAYFLATRGEFRKAHIYFEKAISFEPKEPAFTAKVFQGWGYCHLWEGGLKKALVMFNDSLELFKKTGHTEEQARSLEALGYGNLLQGNLEKGIFFFSQSLRIRQRIGDAMGLCSAQIHLAAAHTLQGDFEKSSGAVKKALALSQQKESTFYQALAHLHHAMLEMEQEKQAETLSCLEKAKSFIKAGPHHFPAFILMDSLLLEAHIEKIKSDKPSSPKTNSLNRLLSKVKKQAGLASVEQGVLSRSLGKYYAFIKNFDNAEKYFKQSIRINENLERRVELARSYYDHSRFLEDLFGIHDALKKSSALFAEAGAENYSEKISALSSYDHRLSRHSTQSRLGSDRHMNMVLEVSHYLSSILNLDELLEKIMDSAIQMAGAERGLLFLYNETGQLEMRVLRNIDKNIGQAQISLGIIQKVEKEKKPVFLEDATRDPDLKSRSSVIKQEIKSVICVPILTRQALLGVLYVENRLVSGAFNQEDLHALTLIANQAGISIENAKLYQRAVTDGMTGLYNRVFFDEYLYKNIQLAARYEKKLSVMIFDVDHFKQINDRYGHQAGDMVIQGVSQFLKSRLRQSDLASRFGGDEFAVILPETSLEQAKGVAENLRKSMEAQTFTYQGQPIRVTLSLGVSEFIKDQNRLQLVADADKALYAAKQAGRNAVKTSLDVHAASQAA